MTCTVDKKTKAEVLDVESCLEWLSDRDGGGIVVRNKDWIVESRYINNEIWYSCYRYSDDYMCFIDDYDYSSLSLIDALDYCNNVLEDSFYYYNY